MKPTPPAKTETTLQPLLTDLAELIRQARQQALRAVGTRDGGHALRRQPPAGAALSSLPTSKQLAEAMLAGVPIIVCTLQTFPHAQRAIPGPERAAGRQPAA